jgi:arginyl-tRNA synthetase
VQQFRNAAVDRLARASGLERTRVSELLQEAQPERGEFALPCFTLAKELKEAPPAIASRIADALEPGDGIAEAKAEGPYVNVHVDRGLLARRTLLAASEAGDNWGASDEGRGRTVVVDYSSPNVAKPLAFHHLRSTMIGHSLVQIYRAGAWETVGINHLGDWGTGFGKLLLAWELYGRGQDLDTMTAEALVDLYVRINNDITEEKKAGGSDLEERARDWFRRLEQGDPTARGLWQRFTNISEKQFSAVYKLLGVDFDCMWGESRYEARMPAVMQELTQKGLLEESEGAQVVHLDAEGMPPCLICKADGATLYATRDIAAALERQEAFGFERALYVTDRGQALHFKQFSRVLEKAGHAWAREIRHVPFGVIRMGGKRARTREGGVVLLVDVLEAAISKVRELIREKNPDLIDADDVARDVGVGAVIFNDLKNRRETDIDFDLDAIVRFDGRTGPYVMYSHARACSILRKSGEVLRRADEVDVTLLEDEAEHALVRLIALFPARVDRARDRDEPSEVAKYLLDLCEAFHHYHTKGGRDMDLRVLHEDADVRAARLRLTDAVRQTMKNALALLGMQAPSAM